MSEEKNTETYELAMKQDLCSVGERNKLSITAKHIKNYIQKSKKKLCVQCVHFNLCLPSVCHLHSSVTTDLHDRTETQSSRDRKRQELGEKDEEEDKEEEEGEKCSGTERNKRKQWRLCRKRLIKRIIYNMFQVKNTQFYLISVSLL